VSKARLKTPENYLCGVGTSATLGSDEEKESLLDYERRLQPDSSGAVG